MKKLITLITFSFTLLNLFSQPLTWTTAKNLSCCSSVNGFAFDKNANMFVAGIFYGDDYVGPYYLSSTTPYKYNSFIAKTNKGGLVLWAKTIGSNESVTVQRIETDNLGNVFICGFYVTDLVYDGVTLPSSGATDAFIMKIDNAGALLWWDHTMGTTGSELFFDLAVNNSGDVYVTGEFNGSMNIQGAYYFAAPSSVFDMCVIKFNGATGAFVWARQTNSSFGSNSCGRRIAVDNLGNTYVLGNFGTGYTTFGDYTIYGSFNDYFVSRLDEGSNYIYTNDIGDIPNGYICNIEADVLGNIYMAGNFGGFSPYSATISGTTITSPGNSEIFLAKYNSDFIMQWIQQGGGTSTGDFAADLAVANDGDAYIAFSSGASVTFGAVSATSAYPGANDIAVVKYNTSGIPQSATVSGGTGFDGVSCIDILQNKHAVGISGIGDVKMYFGAKKVNASNLYVAKFSDPLLREPENIINNEIVYIYPNPASDHIMIEGLQLNSTIEIVDMNGKILLNQNVFDENIEINTSGFAAGIYIVSIIGESSATVQKLIIE